jgi:hypothetical protein
VVGLAVSGTRQRSRRLVDWSKTLNRLIVLPETLARLQDSICLTSLLDSATSRVLTEHQKAAHRIRDNTVLFLLSGSSLMYMHQWATMRKLRVVSRLNLRDLGSHYAEYTHFSNTVEVYFPVLCNPRRGIPYPRVTSANYDIIVVFIIQHCYSP